VTAEHASYSLRAFLKQATAETVRLKARLDRLLGRHGTDER